MPAIDVISMMLAVNGNIETGTSILEDAMIIGKSLFCGKSVIARLSHRYHHTKELHCRTRIAHWTLFISIRLLFIWPRIKPLLIYISETN